MAPEKDDTSTILRMAGNIATGLVPLILRGTGEEPHTRHLHDLDEADVSQVAFIAVEIAKAIVGEAQKPIAPVQSAEGAEAAGGAEGIR